MQTKTLRIGLACGLALGCLLGGFWVGQNHGYNDASKKDTKFAIVAFSNLYKLADAGHTNALRGKLQTLTYMYVMDYELRFSQDADTDPAFLKSLSEATTIADGVDGGALGKPKQRDIAR